MIQIGELSKLADPTCSYRNISVDTGGKRTFDLPELGHTVYAFAYTLPGFEVPTIVVHRALTGEVGILVGDEKLGSPVALDQIAEAQEPASSANADDGGSTDSTQRLPTGCSDTTGYKLRGDSWANGVYGWYFNGSKEPVSGWSLPPFKTARDTVSYGVTRCGANVLNNATYKYEGVGTREPSPRSTGGCNGSDGQSTIGWGPIPDNYLALTCTNVFGSLTIDADIKFDTEGSYFWFNRGSACSGNLYSFQGVATHEIGHAYGLLDITNKTYLTMRSAAAKCDRVQEQLNNGDAYGIKALYG